MVAKPKPEPDELDLAGPEEPAPMPEDELMAKLAALGQGLAKVAGDEAKAKGVTDEIIRLLESCSIKDYQRLAENETIQSFLELVGMRGAQPGEVKGRGTLAERYREHTYEDFAKLKQVTFTPRESIEVICNGLTYYLFDDVEVTVPEPVYNIYQEHRQAIKFAEVNQDYLQGYTLTPPPSQYLTDEHARIVALSRSGRPDPMTRGRGPVIDEDEA